MTGDVVVLGTPGLGIVVSVGSWRITAHRIDCNHYRNSQYRDRPVSPGMALNICRYCRPSEGELTAFLPTIGLYVYAHAIGATRAVAPLALGGGPA